MPLRLSNEKFTPHEVARLNLVKHKECGSGIRIPPKGQRPIARTRDLRGGERVAGEPLKAHVKWSKGVSGYEVTPATVRNIRINRRNTKRDRTNMFNRSGPMRGMKL